MSSGVGYTPDYDVFQHDCERTLRKPSSAEYREAHVLYAVRFMDLQIVWLLPRADRVPELDCALRSAAPWVSPSGPSFSFETTTLIWRERVMVIVNRRHLL